jgi:hypothetical protein
MFFFFLLTVISGLFTEITTLTDSKRQLLPSTVYTIGTLVFLFYEDYYIAHTYILGLVMLSIVASYYRSSILDKHIQIKVLDGDEEYERQKPILDKRLARFEKIDACVSILLLILLLIHSFIATHSSL